MFDSQVSILDGFPPHEWHGPTACEDWPKGLLAYDDKNGITDGDAKLGTPLTVDVNEDHAYFVAPLTYTYKQRGKLINQGDGFFCRGAEANASSMAHYRLGILKTDTGIVFMSISGLGNNSLRRPACRRNWSSTVRAMTTALGFSCELGIWLL